MTKKMTKKLSFLVSAMIMANLGFAANQQQIVTDNLDDERLSDQRIQQQIEHIPNLESAILKPKKLEHQPAKDSLSLSKEALSEHPQLVVRALLAAVIQGNTDNVELLFPIYQNIPEQLHDPMLMQWSQAILARQKQDYSQAVRLYRQIIAVKSDILPANLQLAITLFENNELEAAEAQFKKLRAEPLSDELQILVARYLNAITQRDRWTVGGSLTYLNDPNINNAPKIDTIQQGSGVLKAEPKQSAQGIGVNANIGKKWSWGDGYFNTFSLNTNGKYYWDNKKYNEAGVNASVGMGYQNGRMLFAVAPFIEQTFYAGGSSDNETLKRFSKAKGASIDFNYWLSPNWQLTNSYEYAEQRYNTRKHLDGHYHFLSSGVVYYADAQRQLYTSVNYNQTKTEDESDSFSRRGLTAGWTEEWDRGLSTNLAASYAKKKYKGPVPLFGDIHRDEYGFQASVWHRALHFRGITPRLTYSFNKNKSNHPFYSYDKNRVYISFSKQF